MKYLIVGIIIIAAADLIWKAFQKGTWLDDAQKKQSTRFEYLNQAILEEPDENRVWDTEKGRWVDLAQIKRMERYKEYRKGKPPTYEEWKAAKLAAEKEKGSTPKNS